MDSGSWEPIVDKVLAGTVRPEDIPDIPQRIVRVYLSSTGVDSVTERNVFVERVYPRLREYCIQRYGVEFQMVDLDWGVPHHEGAAVDVSAADFRVKELQRCHDVSAGPSFVAFIGQKYGEAPLPAVIPAKEFEILRFALKSHKGRETRAAPLLDKWYHRDDNSLPPIYTLDSVKDRLPDIASGDVTRKANAHEQWVQEEKGLRRLLQKAADLSYLDGLIDGDTKQKYHMSGQDLAVQQGTEESGYPHDRCVLITRTIVDLRNYVDDPIANNFADVVLNDRTDMFEIDETTSRMIRQLKIRGKALISDSNSLEYDVLWRYDDVIHPVLHAPYLNKLCTDLHDTLMRLIDVTVTKTKFDVEPDMFEEVLQHWLSCRRKVVDFCGRQSQLTCLEQYITGQTNTPFVVYGEPGSGKSSILAKLASEISHKISGHTICAIRFVGYTPKSTDIKQIIMTLCWQLKHALGRDTSDIPYDFNDLQRHFHALLNSIPTDTKLFLFLGAVEKLIPEYNSHFMSWLPTQLKPNVKIVISTHPEKHGILQRLKDDIMKDSSSMLEMTQMPMEDAEELMQHILLLYGRTVTTEQMNVFRSAFTTCSHPMYVQLLADTARTMNSSETLDIDTIPKGIREAIHTLFTRLENKHGKLLVSRSIGYLVASVTGLSDSEMDDLLSLDDDVLNAVFTSYHPSVRRIPCIKWLMIKDDIEQFLKHREADGVTVYLWCHEEFESVVRERYLADANVTKVMHSMLADYFLGTWAGKLKPVDIPENYDGPPIPCGTESERLVAAQPLSFEVPGAPVRFNRRKYDQVPRHLYLAGRSHELNSLVLFNYEWLYNKIKALSLTHIMADFILNPGEEATLVEEALRVAETTIQNDINNLAPEISGHLLPYYKTHPNIRALVQQCDTAGLNHCALIPNFPYHQVPGSSLQYTLKCPMMGESFCFSSNDDRYLLTKVRDSSFVYQYDVVTGESKGNVFASNGDLYVTPNGELFIIFDHVTEKAIKIHRSDTGVYVGQLIVMNHIQLKPKEKYKMGAVSLTNERIAVIVSTESSYLCLADLVGCQFLQIIALDGKCNICQVMPNGRYVFCNSNEFILCYDMYSLEHICTVSVGYKPTALAFTQDGFRAFLANQEETKLLVLHIHKGAVEMAYKTVLDENMPDDKIFSLKVSPKDDMVLVRGKNHILVYNRFSEKVCAHFSRPNDIPKEFKLPKSHYVDINFTNAEFSRDGNFIIATLFRNIYLWQVPSGNLISTIQAPVGIITQLLVSKQRSQIITHMSGSKDIQVWNINEAVNQVNMLDKLTGRIEDIRLTADNTVAYVRCKDSDEIGVVDMNNGVMLDLLTHDSPIHDMATTPDGHYLVVSTRVKRRNVAVKVWNMDERKIVKEFGNTTGYCVGANDSQSIVYVAQEQMFFKAPYFITKFNFMGDSFREHTHPMAVKYVLDKPFLTNDDKHIVVLTAQDYIESSAVYETPTICAFSLDNDLKVSYYTPESFQEAVIIDTIEKVKPCPGSTNSVVVIYTKHSIVVDGNGTTDDFCSKPLGLLILDIPTGAINAICEPFLAPGVRLDSLVFSGINFCIDSNYNIFDIFGEPCTGQLRDPGVPASTVCLQGNAVVYFQGTRVFVMSVSTGHVIANCEVHATICHLTMCSDQRTIILGCEDGTIVSYVIIDPSIENPGSVIATLGSRSIEGVCNSGRTSRSWDKVEHENYPSYSRPPSGLSTGSKDKILLNKVNPVKKVRPNSDTLMYLNTKSTTCVVQ